MTTAREQAREAAQRAVSANMEHRASAMKGADAASDVWEPIVRNLLAEIVLAYDFIPEIAIMPLDAAIQSAKEALDA